MLGIKKYAREKDFIRTEPVRINILNKNDIESRQCM